MQAALLQRLSGIETLDRPPGLERILAEACGPAPVTCKRSLKEELLRSPVCGCGFLPSSETGKKQAAVPMDPEESIEQVTSLSRHCM